MKLIIFKLFMLTSITVQAQFQEHIIESVTYPVGSIALTDIDNDNDNDLVVAGGENNQLKWFENTDGQGNFNVAHGIFERPYSVYAGEITLNDIEADNDVDIMVTTTELDCGEIRTFRNTDGLGNFEQFSTSMSTCGLQGPIGVSDIDGDNDNDWVSSVSASEYNDPKVSWFENDGNGNVTEHIIDENYVRSFQLVDIDNDNDSDLVGFNPHYNQQIFWYENTDGLGNFNKHAIINNPDLNYYSKLISADLDNDGNIDIITAYNKILSWYKNDGQGNFSAEKIINNDTNFTKLNVLAIDLNSDGYEDIISTGDNNSITYYSNDGQENFTTETIIENIYRLYSPIYAKDVNGDNKIDIISNSSENEKIAWYENTMELSINGNNVFDFSIYPNPSKNIVHVESKINISQIKIFNQTGSLVLSVLNNNNIDISPLSSGLYFIKVTNVDGSTGLKKLVRE